MTEQADNSRARGPEAARSAVAAANSEGTSQPHQMQVLRLTILRDYHPVHRVVQL